MVGKAVSIAEFHQLAKEAAGKQKVPDTYIDIDAGTVDASQKSDSKQAPKADTAGMGNLGDPFRVKLKPMARRDSQADKERRASKPEDLVPVTNRLKQGEYIQTTDTPIKASRDGEYIDTSNTLAKTAQQSEYLQTGDVPTKAS